MSNKHRNVGKEQRAAGTMLPTPDMELRLPREVEDTMDVALLHYSRKLLVVPQLLPGKMVVEKEDAAGGRAGSTYTFRKLVTADYNPRSARAAALPGDDIGNWESWMCVLLGEQRPRVGMFVLSVEIYVAREDGWESVYAAHASSYNLFVKRHGAIDRWPTPARMNIKVRAAP